MLQRLLCITLFFVNGVTSYAQWANATIDSITINADRDQIDYNQSLVMGNNGNLHAVYQRARGGGGWDIYYRERDALTAMWSPEVMINDSANMAFSPAIAIDPNTDEVCIAFEANNGNSLLMVAKNAMGTWTKQAVSMPANSNSSATITIDLLSNVHVAWITEDSANVYKIAYATDESGSFATQVLTGSDPGPFGSGAAPYITCSDTGAAYIAYRGGNFGTYKIHIANNDDLGSANWSYNVFASPNGEDYINQLQIGPNNTMHLMVAGNGCWGCPWNAYYYDKPAGGNWSGPSQINTSAAGEVYEFAIDQQGNVHCLINEVSGNFYTGNVYHATNAGGSWNSNALIADGATYNAHMLLDANDKGYAIAHSGNSSPDMEVIVIGEKQSTVGMAPTPASMALSIFPNPATERIFIRSPHVGQLDVYNYNGQLVHQQRYNGNNAVIHTATWNKGIYLLQLTTATSRVSKQLIVQ